jgi:hypothetical protein
MTATPPAARTAVRRAAGRRVVEVMSGLLVPRWGRPWLRLVPPAHARGGSGPRGRPPN